MISADQDPEVESNLEETSGHITIEDATLLYSGIRLKTGGEYTAGTVTVQGEEIWVVYEQKGYNLKAAHGSTRSYTDLIPKLDGDESLIGKLPETDDSLEKIAERHLGAKQSLQTQETSALDTAVAD